jgi:hypothetical protein
MRQIKLLLFFFISSFLCYINGIQLANFRLLIDRTSSIYLKVKLKALVALSVPDEDYSNLLTLRVPDEDYSNLLTLSVPDEDYSNLLTLSVPDEDYSNLLTLSIPDEDYSN